MFRSPLLTLVTLLISAQLFASPAVLSAAAPQPDLFTLHPKSRIVPLPNIHSLSNASSDVASKEAALLARQLDLLQPLERISTLRKQLESYTDTKVPLELRVEYNEAKEDVIAALEQARLEIDFAQAELAVEIAGSAELLQAYSAERDQRINALNLWSFRTNGALWALAEGLDIPTYVHPRLSIPSGTIGIAAGLVPSAFSAFAVRSSNSGHYDRDPRPNMLSPLFDYQVTPRIEYPKSVWNYLHAPPADDESGRTRLDRLVDNWIEDKNIHVFSDRNSRAQLDSLTGSVQKRLTIDLLADRLNMLQQVSALISQMNRPLLELIMVARGSKHLDTVQ